MGFREAVLVLTVFLASCLVDAAPCTDNDGDGYGDPAVNPGATEVCNGIDDDCDAQTDDGSDTVATDTDLPPSLFFYVVRAGNDCADGGIGVTRDRLVACP